MKPGTADTARGWLEENLVVSVEIGFGAHETQTCGLYRKQKGLVDAAAAHKNFGEAAKIAAQWIGEADGPVALVVEAPLSFFWRKQCPHPRLTLREQRYCLEQRHVWKRSKKTGEYAPTTERRYWYVAPGSTVTLAAGFLLRSLSRAVPTRRFEQVYLFEGFASFKGCGFQPQPPAASDSGALTHADEAVVLANSLATATDLDTGEGVKAESILEAFSISATGAGIPAVIDVYPGEVPQRVVR